MSRLQCRGSIAQAALVVALLSLRPADAQVIVDPGSPREPGGLLNNLVTGVQYDIVNQAVAERRVQQLEAKLRRDTERGDRASADRDVRWIERYRFRIAVDEWLIRKNSLVDPGCYPLLIDPCSRAAIAESTRPVQPLEPLRPVATPGPAAGAPSIAIVNAEPAGADVAFAIDGVAHQAAGGSRQDFAVAPNSTITYDAGGSLGQRRYRLSPGVYEFRSTAEGWALYKRSSTP